MGVRSESSHPSRGKITAIIAAVVVGIALIATGVGFGVHMHAVNVARAREARVIAAARMDCRKSITDLKNAKTSFITVSHTKNVEVASKITVGQVKDKKTITRLKNLLSDDTSYASCTVPTHTGLLKAARANKTAAKMVTDHTTDLAAAAEAVIASKKQLDDQKAKIAGEKKAQAEAKRKADQAAQAARTQAQARKSDALHRTYHYQTHRTYRPMYTPRHSTSVHSSNNGSAGNKKPGGSESSDPDWETAPGGMTNVEM